LIKILGQFKWSELFLLFEVDSSEST